MTVDTERRTVLRKTLVLLEVTQELSVDTPPEEQPPWTTALGLPEPWRLGELGDSHGAAVRELDWWEVVA
jgi:hypothetical protein